MFAMTIEIKNHVYARLSAKADTIIRRHMYFVHIVHRKLYLFFHSYTYIETHTKTIILNDVMKNNIQLEQFTTILLLPTLSSLPTLQNILQIYKITQNFYKRCNFPQILKFLQFKYFYNFCNSYNFHNSHNSYNSYNSFDSYIFYICYSP